MGNLILNFLQEQGTLIILGLMVTGGIFSQVMNARRYGKLRKGIQSLVVLQSPAVHNTEAEAVSQEPVPAKRTSRRSLRGRRKAENLQEFDAAPNQPFHNPKTDTSKELDAQLLYLKQSLDRIAAGRDQTLEEEVREHRKLTPEQESIIADILREYLS